MKERCTVGVFGAMGGEGMGYPASLVRRTTAHGVGSVTRDTCSDARSPCCMRCIWVWLRFGVCVCVCVFFALGLIVIFCYVCVRLFCFTCVVLDVRLSFMCDYFFHPELVLFMDENSLTLPFTTAPTFVPAPAL